MKSTYSGKDPKQEAIDWDFNLGWGSPYGKQKRRKEKEQDVLSQDFGSPMCGPHQMPTFEPLASTGTSEKDGILATSGHNDGGRHSSSSRFTYVAFMNR